MKNGSSFSADNSMLVMATPIGIPHTAPPASSAMVAPTSGNAVTPTTSSSGKPLFFPAELKAKNGAHFSNGKLNFRMHPSFEPMAGGVTGLADSGHMGVAACP